MEQSITSRRKSLNIRVGTIVTIITFLANVLVYLFFTPFLLKSVGDRQYGIYSLALSITTWFSFASSSISIGYVRFYAKEKIDSNNEEVSHLNGVYFLIFAIYASLILVIAVVMTLLMSFKIVVFENYTMSEQNMITIIFAITILGMIPIILFNVFSHFIFANHRFIWFRMGTLLNLLLRTFISIPFLIKGYSIVSVVTIHSITNVVLTVSDVFFAVFYLKIRISFKELSKYKYLFKDIALFTFALLINEAADKLNSTIDPFILGILGYAEITTHYMLGCRMAEYSSQAVLTLAKNFSPTINENVFNKKDSQNNFLFLRLSKMQLVLMAIFVGGFIVCGKEFIDLWLGPEYTDVYYVCISLMILYSYMSTTITSQDIERAKNKHLWRSLIILFTCILNALLTFLFVYYLPLNAKIFGCLIATGLSIFVGYWIILSIYHKKAANIPMKKYWEETIKVSLITLPIIVIVNKIDLFFPFIHESLILSFLIKGIIFCFIFGLLIIIFYRDIIPTFILKFFRFTRKKGI